MARTQLIALVLAVLMVGWMTAQSEEPRRPAATSGPHARTPGPAPAGGGEAQQADVRAFAKQYFPEAYEEVTRQLQDNPQRARPLLAMLTRAYNSVQRFPTGEVRDAAIGRQRANLAISRVIRELRQTENPGERDKRTTRLRELLAEQFDQDQVVKEYDIKRLSEQLASLKAEIEQRKTNRKAVIEEAVGRLLSTSRPASEWKLD